MAVQADAGPAAAVEAVCDDKYKIFQIYSQRAKEGFMNRRIWFHADDFGVTAAQSERILSCFREGVLNSVSILPNAPALPASLALLNQADPDGTQIRRVLHLNFVEGRPLAGADNVPDLVDDTGFFDKSFIFASFLNFDKNTKYK